MLAIWYLNDIIIIEYFIYLQIDIEKELLNDEDVIKAYLGG